MFFVSIYRTIKFAFKNFWRNIWLSVVTIFILILTLFSISLIMSLNAVTDQTIKSIKDKVDIDIYFSSEISEEEIMNVSAFLKNSNKVKEVAYISAEDAWEDFREKHKDDPEISESVEELEGNPLPASLVIKANELEDYGEIVNMLDSSEYSSLIQSRDFETNQEVISKLSNITSRVYQLGLVISGIFIFIAILVVFNTIRITIYTYREEIGIMKLVGATNWFVRAPLILESILYAVIASLITIGLLFLVIQFASPHLNNFFEGYDFDLLNYFYQYYWQIFGMELLISLVLCVFSSMIAIGRYLKVWFSINL